MTEFYSFLEHLLYDHECVIIPQFGGFVVNADDFRFNEIESKIYPKKKCVAFNEKLKTDDRLLSVEWSKKRAISVKEASEEIITFSKEIKSQLLVKGEVKVGVLGTFSLNEQNRISFSPNPEFNADLDVFGLLPVGLGYKNITKEKKPELISTPIADDLPAQTDEVHQSVKMNKAIYVYAFIAFLLGGLGAFFLTEPATNQSQSSLNPIKLEKKETVVAKKTDVKSSIDTTHHTIPKPTVDIEKEVVNPPVENSKDLIYLVAASFESFAQAEKSLKAFKSLGFDQAEIILKNDQSKFYRISLGTEHSMDVGYAKAMELKKSKKVDIWVYKAL